MVGARRRCRSHAVTLPGASSLACGDAPNLARTLLGEPQVAIRAARYALRPATGRGDTAAAGDEAATGGDVPDGVPNLLGIPEVAIRPGRDAPRRAGMIFPTGPWQGEQGDAATGGDAPNGVPILQGIPEVAIRPGRDGDGEATLRLDVELGDGPTGGDASDLVPTGVGKPEVAIRPGGDAPGATGRGEQGHAATGGDAPNLGRAITRAPGIAS